MRAKLPEMTRPPSGSPPHRIDDPAAARLLLDEAVREVFGCFLGVDRSVREAADHLGRDLDAVLYRVKRLHAVGLLDVVATVKRAGRAVRRYRSAHDAWFLPFEVLPYADLEEALATMHRSNAVRAARAAARWLSRSPWAGFTVELGVDGQVWMHGSGRAPDERTPRRWRPVDGGLPFLAPPGATGGPFDATLDLWLSDDQVAQLNADLVAVVARYAAFGRAAADGVPANRMLQVVSVPLGPEDRV